MRNQAVGTEKAAFNAADHGGIAVCGEVGADHGQFLTVPDDVPVRRHLAGELTELDITPMVFQRRQALGNAVRETGRVNINVASRTAGQAVNLRGHILFKRVQHGVRAELLRQTKPLAIRIDGEDSLRQRKPHDARDRKSDRAHAGDRHHVGMPHSRLLGRVHPAGVGLDERGLFD